ncbi:uncharacterized protein [Montipora capricornis]|uniref:uncharacterized protein n=1 Tax=Montipora capricornis TaxID=246305 RepID=UPI0035F1ABD8
MELSGLSNEVLRLLLAQNNLLITGSREQLIERLGSISPSNPSATRTRNSDASASAAKRPRTNRQEPGSSDLPDERRDPTPEDELPGDTPTEPNDNNPEDIQDGGRNEAPPANSAFDPANLATLIGNIVDQKLKNFRPAVQSASSLPTALPTSSSTPQLATTRELGDPTFVASLLSQPSSSTSADLHLPSVTPSSSLADHVPTKTKQAVLRDPTIHSGDSATITTEGPNAAKTPAPSATAAKPATETTQLSATMTPLQNLEARLIRNHQTAEALLSMTPLTPVNIPLLSNLLKTHPNQTFVANLTAGLTEGFRVGYQGSRLPKTAKNLPSAYRHPSIIEGNLLEEVELGRLAGPFESPPLSKFSDPSPRAGSQKE